MDNPYQPIEEPESGSVEYRFDGVVSMKHLAQIHRGTKMSTLAVMLPASLFMLQLSFDSFRFGSNSSGGIFIVFAVLFWLTIYHAWRGPHRFAKAYPHISEPVRGSLGTDFVQIETSTVGHRIQSDTVVVHAANRNFISLRCDLDRLLTPSMFEDYPAALQLAQELQKRSDPLLPGDPRTRDRVPASEENAGPPGSISFVGEQHAGDYETSGVNAGRRRVLAFVILRLLVAIAVVAVVYQSFDSRFLVTLSVLIMGFWFYKRGLKPSWAFLRTASAIKTNPEETFHSVRGWLDEDFVAVWSATGVSRYRWSAFHESVETENGGIVLYGQKNLFFLALHPRLFSSDDDWQQAVSTMRRRITEANQSSEPSGTASSQKLDHA